MIIREPNIIINGKELTPSQSMAVRVAVISFMEEMGKPDALGNDEDGRVMAEAYRVNLQQVVKLMFGKDAA